MVEVGCEFVHAALGVANKTNQPKGKIRSNVIISVAKVSLTF